MMVSRYKQQGATMVSLVALAALLGFVLMIFINLMPVYLENFKVASAVQGLASDARTRGAEDEEIKTLLLKKLDIDDVDDITDENISITRSGGVVVLTVSYEAQVNILGNVDAVVIFDDETVELKE